MKNRLECMQPIRFLVVLLMCCLSYTTWAQTQSNVNGLVTDFSGEPLIGVSILVKGTSNGTVTDLDGKFSLSAEMGEGGNLAASKIRNLECPNYEICLIDYGCGKFNRKIHIMEQYP